MKIDKEELIVQIIEAFQEVALEDGIGLWEGQALDDRIQDPAEYYRLKAKDERKDWRKIPIVDLFKCSSSISFLDAKGMRFHLGLYLLFALDVFEELEDRLHEHPDFNYSPTEVEFALDHNLDSEYSYNRFSLLNVQQIACVIYFLNYRLEKLEETANIYSVKYQKRYEKAHKNLKDVIRFWKRREASQYK